MVEVQVKLKEKGIDLSLKGHAGYAEKGKDIVCAAVSALAIALEIALRKSEVKKHCDFRENTDSGLYEISIDGIRNKECLRMTESFLYMFLSGVLFLQEHYPGNICVNCGFSESEAVSTPQVLKLFERREVRG